MPSAWSPFLSWLTTYTAARWALGLAAGVVSRAVVGDVVAVVFPAQPALSSAVATVSAIGAHDANGTVRP